MVSTERITDSTAIMNLEKGHSMEALPLVAPQEKEGASTRQRVDEWLALNSFLGEHEPYSEDSRLTRLVQDRLDFLTDGHKAEVVIVHDDEPNGFALPSYVVVTDSLLKLVQTQEALDAFLEHEWTHISREHGQKIATSEGTFLQRLGRRRAHETEADLIPIELLDKKGLNPGGFNELLKKLEEHQQSGPVKRKWYEPETDTEHGSLLDRRLNLEELAWLIDIRNLSNQRTPLPLTGEDFDTYHRDDNLWAKDEYDKLDYLSKRHFIERQFGAISETIIKSYGLVTDEQVEKIRLLTQMQADLLQKKVPNISNNELENLLVLSIYGSYGLPYFQPIVFQDKEIALKDWSKQFTDRDRIVSFFQGLDNQIFFELGIRVHNKAIEPVANAIMLGYLSLNRSSIDIPTYMKLVEEIRSYYPSKDYYSQQMYYAPPIEFLFANGTFSPDTARALADNLAEMPVPTSNVLSYATNRDEKKVNQIYETLDEKPKKPKSFDDYVEEYYSEKPHRTILKNTPEYLAATLIGEMISTKRLQKAQGLKDPLELLAFMTRYEGDFFDPIRDEARRITEGDMAADIIKRLLNRYPAKRMVERLQKFAQDNNLSDIKAESFMESLIKVYGEKPDEYDEYGEIITKTLFIKNLSARLILWSICLTKDDFLSQVAKDLRRTILRSNKNPNLVLQTIQLIKDAPRKAQDLGFAVDWEITREDFQHFRVLLESAKASYLTQAAKSKDPHVLVQLINVLPIYNVQGDLELLNWERLEEGLAKILSDRTNIKENIDNLLDIFAFGCITDNTQLLLQLPQKAAEIIVRQLSFEEGARFIFEQYDHLPQHIFAQALDHLIEEKARTLTDFALLGDQVRRRIARFFQDDTTIGEAALVDTFLIDPAKKFKSHTRRVGSHRDIVYGLEPTEFLQAMLQTPKNDEAIKKYLFYRWWVVNRSSSSEVQRSFNIENLSVYRYPGKEGQLNFWLNELPPKDSYKPFPRLVTDVYLSNRAMRYAALRKVLTGRGGVLESQQGKDKLMETFFSEWVDFQKAEAGEKTTRELISALLASGEQDELYQRLNPVLLDLILKFPQEFYPYANLAKTMAQEKITDMKQDGVLTNPTTRDIQLLERKILLLMLGGNKEDTQLDLSEGTEKLLNIFMDSTEPTPSQAFTPWELALIVGEKSGAVGVRMLQLSGQYFEVPTQMHDRLMDIYDSVKGQSRLQAYRVLMRETEFSPAMADIVENIAEIHPRVGGGSLMTVYDVHFKDGSRKALAVRNPNVEYHVGKTVDLLKRTIQYAIAQNPQDRNYQLMAVLLDDVEQWVSDEIHDPTFEEKDQRFRVQNDGRFGQFSGGNNKYQLLVPDIIPTQTRWIRCEDFVDGQNLTSLKITDGETDITNGQINREDYRQVVSLLVSNYVYQLVSTGLVHADVHPGNFRITPDNSKVAVFDRYNLLELDGRDKNLIKGLVMSFAGGGVDGVRRHFVDYALSLPENQELAGTKDALLNEIKQKAAGADIEKAIIDSIILLKQRGIKIPLKISLIGKNLQALNRMSKEAGFDNLMQAHLHTQPRANLLSLFTTT